MNDPWPTLLFVPQGSSVRISCTADSNSPSIFWSIDLASHPSTVQFQFGTGSAALHAAGVYELSDIKSDSKKVTTLRLLINDTAMNNGTIIHCTHGQLSSPITATTSLFVFGKFFF